MLFLSAMPDARAMNAIARIERALARIEAAASVQRPEEAAELDALRAKHHALREKVEGAVSQIDQLLVGRGAS